MTDGAEIPLKVLVVEDEQVVAAHLERSLTSLGYQVLNITATARAALRSAEKERPDLVLMDIQLKGTMDGIAAADEIVKRWNIPVVFLTASTNEEVVLRAKAAGPYGYLTKPFRVHELNATLLLAMEQHRRAQELFSERAWLRTLLSSISDGVIAIDAEARIQFMNPVAEKLTGWLAAEVLGKKLRDIWITVTIDGEAVFKCRLEQALEEAEPVTQQRFMLLSREGYQRPIEDSASPILQSGRAIGAVSVFRDISEVIRRERQQQEERDRLEEQAQQTETALGQTRAELRELSAHMMSSIEEERGRIARDLHDDFVQRTALLEMEVNQLEGLVPDSNGAGQMIERIRARIATLSEDMRRMSHTLYPTVLRVLGLSAALRSLGDEFTHNGLNVSVRVAEVPAAISLETTTALYRITQEALRNVLKHCPYAKVRVVLSHKRGELQLTIEDTGPGFNLAQARAKHGLGLLSMQERARMIDGNMLIRTAPKQGTQIVVRVPVSTDPAAQS